MKRPRRLVIYFIVPLEYYMCAIPLTSPFLFFGSSIVDSN